MPGLDLLCILQIVALEVDLGCLELAALVVNTLSFHPSDPESGQPRPTAAGIEESSDRGTWVLSVKLKRQLGTTPKEDDNFVASFAHDDACDLDGFGGRQRTKDRHDKTPDRI